jgi:hypothetical protein
MLTRYIVKINHVLHLNRQDVTQIKINLRKKKRKRGFNYLHGKRIMKSYKQRGVKKFALYGSQFHAPAASPSMKYLWMDGSFEEYRVYVNYIY